MSFDPKILSEKIEGLKEAFENGRFGDALVAAVNTGSGLMQQRIFTANVDVNGDGFGEYIGKRIIAKRIKSANRTADKRNKAIAGESLTPYQIKRASKGRQILKKDLEMTGALRRAIETQVEGEHSAILQFSNLEAAKIAHGQENQITNIRLGAKATTKGAGIKIFKLNQEEKEEVISQGVELIKEILQTKKP